MSANRIQKSQSHHSGQKKATNELLLSYISIFNYFTILYSPYYHLGKDYIVVNGFRRCKAYIDNKVYCYGKNFSPALQTNLNKYLKLTLKENKL